MESDANRPRLQARKANERPHVLIVTDDPDLADFLAQGLPLGGFWASVIANGLQALEVFRLRQFDLIVLDAEMRSFDAFEFLRRLRGVSELDRNRDPRSTAPALLIYSSEVQESAAQPSDLGVEAALFPPLELSDVVRTLHDIFGRWRRNYPDTPLADSSSLRAF